MKPSNVKIIEYLCFDLFHVSMFLSDTFDVIQVEKGMMSWASIVDPNHPAHL